MNESRHISMSHVTHVNAGMGVGNDTASVGAALWQVCVCVCVFCVCACVCVCVCVFCVCVCVVCVCVSLRKESCHARMSHSVTCIGHITH